MWVYLWLRDWSAIGHRLRRDMILTNSVGASCSLCDENAVVLFILPLLTVGLLMYRVKVPWIRNDTASTEEAIMS